MGSLSLGINLFSQKSLTPGCESQSISGLLDPTATAAFFNNTQIPPLTALATRDTSILGVTSADKWIEVDLSEQRLIAHQGDQIFLESPISSGLSFPTPEGTYNVWYKIRFTKMEGGSKAANTYYYLPNVPYTMFFSGNFGIHGTYWHNNFGQRMSHGCVNTPTPVAERLFYWVGPVLPADKSFVRATVDNPGTRVVVHP
jgi:lipoprotein-anchoring transpeptidase ErfK/SrfK